MTPAPEEIRAALEQVLASDVFANAGRLSRLLRYLVERTLNGDADQLKEYVVGVDVFDRSDSYDPRLDSIVRVEARRLRSKLDEYYQAQGAADALIISIPRGTYVPVFSLASNTSQVSHVSTDEGQRRVTARSTWRWAVIAGVAAAGVIVGVLAFRSTQAPSSAAQASSGPSIAVLPFQHYSPREADAMIAARITDAVTTELARLGTVSVASRTTASGFTAHKGSVREIAKALDVAFVMEGSALVAPSGVRVEARLVDAALDRKVWVGKYDGSIEEIMDLTRLLAGEAAAAMLKFSSH
jgi:adenylate cyclase